MRISAFLSGSRCKSAIVLAGSLFFQNAYGQHVSRWTKYCDETADKTITIHSVEAKITIQGYEGDSIIVEAVKKTNSCSPRVGSIKRISDNKILKGAEVNFEKKNNNLLMKVYGEGFYAINIKLPRKLPVLIVCLAECPNDSLKIAKLDNLVSISGEVKVISITDSNLSGGLDVNSKSGKILINNINVDFPARNASGIISLQTTGEIDLALSNSAKVDLQAFSKDGDIYSDLPFEKKQQSQINFRDINKENSYSGVLNNGGVKLYVRTVFGNVIIRREMGL